MANIKIAEFLLFPMRHSMRTAAGMDNFKCIFKFGFECRIIILNDIETTADIRATERKYPNDEHVPWVTDYTLNWTNSFYARRPR